MAEVHGLSEHDAAGTVRNVSIIIVGAIVIVSIPAGRLSDRFGRKPVIYASCGVGMVSMVVAALAPQPAGRVSSARSCTASRAARSSRSTGR